MASDNFMILVKAGPIESSDVMRLRIERRLGQVAFAEIDVYFPEAVEPDELLGSTGAVAFGRGELEHELAGVVSEVSVVATSEDKDGRGTVHHLRLSSLMALLEHDVDCRIFQDMDVKEIVTEVLQSHGIDPTRQSWQLGGSYPKLEYTVQYNESALHFVSRLCEKEGIYFHSAVDDEGERIVFEDESVSAEPISGDKALPYRYGSGLDKAQDAVAVITQRHRTASGKVVLRDYNFKKPKVDLTASAEASEDTALELYDYPGLYQEPADGKRLAKVKLEARQAERSVLEVEGACPRVLPARVLELTDTENSLDGEYFVTSVVHELSRVTHEPAAGGARVPGGAYLMRATLIPKAVPFRCPQLTPWPVIDGPQTAVIVAPPGSPDEEIHTDQHGRCKVHFHWDRYGKPDDTASCWMRVTQPQTSGSMVLPRVDWEVIVEFLEGNPDRPIITGRVYNGRFMPPYALPEGKSRTAIQTASSPGGKGRNAIRFEDKAGKEEVKIQAQKDTTLATANNKTTSITSNATKNVAVNSTLTVGANQTVQVTNGYLDTVGGAQSVNVGGSRTVEVNAVYGLTSGGASSTTVSGNQFEMDGNPIQALLDLAVKAATDAAKAEAQKQLGKLDQAVSDKVNQVMGPINKLQDQAQKVSDGMQAVSNGNLGAAAGTLSAAAGLPTPGGFANALGGGGGQNGGGGAGGGGGSGGASSSLTSALGIDSLVSNAIQSGGDKLGKALGGGGGGGGGSSQANTAGPDGAVGGNAAADSATGPGHAVNVCSSTHSETIGSIKTTIAAAGIHTTVKGDRSQNVGAARVELVAGTRAETCSGNKTDKAVGLVVVSSAPESEQVGGSRTTMVGGAILEKIGAGQSVSASGKAMFVGAFHKIDASGSISLKCGSSEVTIDGGGVTIKSALVTISAPTITLTSTVSQA